jgi:hypothetical protein
MWILTDLLKITFLDISEIYLRTFDNYMLFQISPYLDSSMLLLQLQSILDVDHTHINDIINGNEHLNKMVWSLKEMLGEKLEATI